MVRIMVMVRVRVTNVCIRDSYMKRQPLHEILAVEFKFAVGSVEDCDELMLSWSVIRLRVILRIRI